MKRKTLMKIKMKLKRASAYAYVGVRVFPLRFLAVFHSCWIEENEINTEKKSNNTTRNDDNA
jgi:hypothetical protein